MGKWGTAHVVNHTWRSLTCPAKAAEYQDADMMVMDFQVQAPPDTQALDFHATHPTATYKHADVTL